MLIYDVAVSLDGFIAGPNGDVSAFPFEGPHVEAYLARLATYETVLMGRRTYEFGYAWGLEPGARAYPHMDHCIVSKTLIVPSDAAVSVTQDSPASVAARLKAASGGPIYLCGGGQLAGALADADMIDELCLKIVPVVLGHGVRLFENLGKPLVWHSIGSELHGNGVTTARFARIGS
jgi:dihydrofolate reductase